MTMMLVTGGPWLVMVPEATESVFEQTLGQGLAALDDAVSQREAASLDTAPRKEAHYALRSARWA